MKGLLKAHTKEKPHKHWEVLSDSNSVFLLTQLP